MIQSQRKGKKRERRGGMEVGREGAGLLADRRERGLSVMSCLFFFLPTAVVQAVRQTRK